MNQFTLSTALNGIKKNLIVTAVIFLVTYYLLHNSNIIENRYKMQKIISPATFMPGHSFDFLDYRKINAILSSANTALFLDSNIESGEASRFKVAKTDEDNIVIQFNDHNRENIIKTAELIMNRMQVYDELQIQKKIIVLNKDIADQHKMLQTILLPDEEYVPTNADIEKFAAMQKIYDNAYETGSFGQTGIDLDKIVSLKREEVNKRVSLNQEILSIEKQIELLETIKNSFKAISYLFPLSPQEITKYYPNQMLFFSIALFVSLLYNLVMLNIIYIKHNSKA